MVTRDPRSIRGRTANRTAFVQARTLARTIRAAQIAAPGNSRKTLPPIRIGSPILTRLTAPGSRRT